jgi:hypothetical protein
MAGGENIRDCPKKADPSDIAGTGRIGKFRASGRYKQGTGLTGGSIKGKTCVKDAALP